MSADIDQRFRQLAEKLAEKILRTLSEILEAFRAAWKKNPVKLVEYVECIYDWTAWFKQDSFDVQFKGFKGASRGEYKLKSDMERPHFFEWTRSGKLIA